MDMRKYPGCMFHIAQDLHKPSHMIRDGLMCVTNITWPVA